jgi:hypothetical protein
MKILDEVEINNMLTFTQGLLNHVYWIRHDLSLNPGNEHILSAINYSDINERRSDFLNELVNTVTSWVYSKEKIRKIMDERLDVCNGDYGNASTFLATHAFSKFRPGHPQGQFGELLLFNFIQFFFKAIPILRKQRITTSVGHERFGSDAIHYKKNGIDNIIILGESKCYKSDYKFKSAFATSLSSIESSFSAFNDELNLYMYDDFIEPEIEDIAKRYKNGTLGNVKFELVCLIAYNETKKISGDNEAKIKETILSIVRERCDSLGGEVYEAVSSNILSRINYIIFPIWNLDDLLAQFQIKIGSKCCGGEL